MPQMVKCRKCGEKVDKKIAYCTVVNGKNEYYCSKEEYIKKLNDSSHIQSAKHRAYELLDNTTNTALYKELTEIAKVHGYEKISNYLEDNEDYLYNVLHTKTFSSEYGKIKYFAAILKNNLGDYIIQEPEPIRQVEVDIVDNPKYKQKKRRRSLAEIEGEL